MLHWKDIQRSSLEEPCALYTRKQSEGNSRKRGLFPHRRICIRSCHRSTPYPKKYGCPKTVPFFEQTYVIVDKRLKTEKNRRRTRNHKRVVYAHLTTELDHDVQPIKIKRLLTTKRIKLLRLDVNFLRSQAKPAKTRRWIDALFPGPDLQRSSRSKQMAILNLENNPNNCVLALTMSCRLLVKRSLSKRRAQGNQICHSTLRP